MISADVLVFDVMKIKKRCWIVCIILDSQERLRLSDGVDCSRVSVSKYIWRVWDGIGTPYVYICIHSHSEIGEGGRWHPEACVLLAVQLRIAEIPEIDLGASRIGMVHGFAVISERAPVQFSSLQSSCFFMRFSFDPRIRTSGKNVQSLRATSKLDCCILCHVSLLHRLLHLWGIRII